MLCVSANLLCRIQDTRFTNFRLMSPQFMVVAPGTRVLVS